MSNTQPKPQLNYALILATLRKRKAAGMNSLSQASLTAWPSHTPFTLLNNLDATQIRIQEKPKTLNKNRSAVSFKQGNRNTVIHSLAKVVNFDRPFTSSHPTRKTRLTQKAQQNNAKKRDVLSRSLFDHVRDQKLARLQQQKQQLMTYIFSQDKAEIHRLDQDEQTNIKPNAINFKTYHSLNKLMDLSDQIYHTINYRPKTGGDRLKKSKITRS